MKHKKLQDLSPLTGKLKCRFPGVTSPHYDHLARWESSQHNSIGETHSSRNRGSETQVYLPHFLTYLYLAPVSIHTELILLLLIDFWDLRPCVCVSVFLIFAIRLWDQRLCYPSSKFHNTILHLILFTKGLQDRPRGIIISIRIPTGNRILTTRLKWRYFNEVTTVLGCENK